ncbi:MAG: PAS domain S-box protein [Gallionellaceae bacterium]|nr:PAS domain S-box protein [Gallionellaceae bacterium]
MTATDDQDNNHHEVETEPQELDIDQERAALLFMLEDIERGRHQVDRAHREWIAAMDAMADPVFMHDRDYRIMRCNRAYAEHAGMTVRDVIGKPYYEVFPRLDGPLPHCCKSMQEAEEEIRTESGEVFASRSFSVRGDDGGYLYSLHVMEDITERKRMQQALQESEEKFRQISATAQDAILMMDNAGRIVFWNSAAEKMFGYAAEETLGKELHALIVPERFRDAFHKNHPAFVATGQGAIIGKTVECAAFGKNPAEFPVELSVSAAKLGGQWHAVGFIRDISERKQAAEALRRERDLATGIIETAQAIILLLDAEGRILRFNPYLETVSGFTLAETQGKDWFDTFLPERDRNRIRALFHKAIEGIQTLGDVNILVTRDGEERQIEWYDKPLKDASGNSVGLLCIGHDVTERKQAEHRKEIEESRLRASLKFGRMPDADDKAILDLSLDEGVRVTESRYGFIGWINEDESVMTIHAWSKEAMAACAVEQPPIEYPIARAGIWAEPLRTRAPLILNDYAQTRHPHKHGTPQGHVEIRRYLGVPVFDGERIVMIAAVANKEQEYEELDATTLSALMSEAWRVIQRNRAEQALQRANRAFRTLSAGNHELVHATDEIQLLQAMCRVIVEIGGYSAAWVGYRQGDAEKSVRPMAYCGFEPGFVDTLQITWADSERGCGPTGRAVRTGMTQMVRDVANDPDCAPWREQALKRGQASAIALPLRSNSEVSGCLTIYAAESMVFGQDEIALLEEMAGDLAFGLRMLRLRQEQQHSAEQVRMGLAGTIQAIAAMVEMRDPYTAGHQRRVADLAAAIAVAMGLPEEQVRGLHLAGTIHDLGKIQTPAEILSKPGKLSASEFSLIKDHPQNGYEILKDIEFPWPIAQMVLQHHEKLDGSGYPQGLKGNEILLEAKIMTVADVVEAMSSHRPYRPGLGLEAALAEIAKGRGTHYDPDAVDACIKLFKEAGFVFG